MIAKVTGKVIETTSISLIVEVGSLAYEIFVPSAVIESYKKAFLNSNLPESDSFYTIQYIEGSSGHGNQFVRLVGFKRLLEKSFFQLYTSVEGLGYRTALKSLTLPIGQIAMAIENGDVNTLKSLPHVGKRTAEKMIASLKGRMQRFVLDDQNEPLTLDAEPDLQAEVLQVLKQVGINHADALQLISKVIKSKPEIKAAEEMIQEIFRIKNNS